MSKFALRANYSCPDCGRDTLTETPDEIVDFKCSVCDERVREDRL